jgi:hypothetical protein
MGRFGKLIKDRGTAHEGMVVNSSMDSKGREFQTAPGE